MTWGGGDLCDKHELAYCTLCKPKPKVAPKASSSSAPNFRGVRALEVVAQFETICVECEEDIVVGDPIRCNDDGKWVHEECP